MTRTELIEKELLRQKRKDTRIRRLIITAIAAVIVVTSVFIVERTLVRVIRIDGKSMENTYKDGNYVLAYTKGEVLKGKIAAIEYGDQIIVKRIIAEGGDIVDIDNEGNVTVNGSITDEPYVYEKAIGNCDIELPHEVAENCYFVMGDHRLVSLDSRYSEIGDIKKEKIIGILLFQE